MITSLAFAGQRYAVLGLARSGAAAAEALLAMDGAAFGEAVSGFFEHRLGHMHPVTTPQAYPLVGVYAERFIAAGAALIGDAAVGMHPVTAHGFNLGLASQQRLARLVVAQQARTLGPSLRRQLDGGLAGAGDVTLLDPGALDDPFVRGFDNGFKLGVGDDTFGQIMPDTPDHGPDRQPAEKTGDRRGRGSHPGWRL